MPGIPLLQRYLFWELLRAFLFVLSCTTVLLVFVGVFQQATAHGMGAEQLLQILPYIVPSMLPFTIPAALLLTISAVYGRVAGDSELTAAKAAGIHPLSVMWPAFVLGALLSLAALILTDQVIPWSIKRMEQQILAVMEDVLIEQLRTELQFTDPGHRFHITVAGVHHRTLQQPVIRYMRGQQVVTLKAESAEIQLDPEQQVAHVTLHNSYSETAGQRFVFNRDLHIPIRWAQRKNAPPPRNFPIEAIDEEIVGIDRTRSRTEERQILKVAMALTVADFRSAVDIQTTGNSGLKRLVERKRKLRTEIHSRYALACSCLFFSLLGAPFSILFGKKQFLTSFLLCFLPIVGGYYPLMLGLMTQAKEGHVAPEWAMWVGNALLFIGSYFALRRVIRF